MLHFSQPRCSLITLTTKRFEYSTTSMSSFVYPAQGGIPARAESPSHVTGFGITSYMIIDGQVPQRDSCILTISDNDEDITQLMDMAQEKPIVSVWTSTTTFFRAGQATTKLHRWVITWLVRRDFLRSWSLHQQSKPKRADFSLCGVVTSKVIVIWGVYFVPV